MPLCFLQNKFLHVHHIVLVYEIFICKYLLCILMMSINIPQEDAAVAATGSTVAKTVAEI